MLTPGAHSVTVEKPEKSRDRGRLIDFLVKRVESFALVPAEQRKRVQSFSRPCGSSLLNALCLPSGDFREGRVDDYSTATSGQPLRESRDDEKKK